MLKNLLAVLALVLAPLAAGATEKGTAEEATEMANQAVAVYENEGLDALIAAVMDKSNTDFHYRDLYVFVSEIDGDLLAHGANPGLVGRDLGALVDANGKPFVQEMIEIARNVGEGWVDYVWSNPKTKKMEPKSTRILRFGEKYYVGVGIYKG